MSRFLVLALALAFAGPALATPPVPASREAINAALDGVQSLPLPVPEAGEIRIGRPADERRLDRSFLEDLAAQPDWPDQGIAFDQRGFPEEIGEQQLYQPVERGLEIKIAEKLARLRDLDARSGSFPTDE